MLFKFENKSGPSISRHRLQDRAFAGPPEKSRRYVTVVITSITRPRTVWRCRHSKISPFVRLEIGRHWILFIVSELLDPLEFVIYVIQASLIKRESPISICQSIPTDASKIAKEERSNHPCAKIHVIRTYMIVKITITKEHAFLSFLKKKHDMEYIYMYVCTELFRMEHSFL